MREWMQKRNIRWGVTAFVVIAASIFLAIGLSRLTTFMSWLKGVLSAFTPLVWGVAIAYILNPVAGKIERLVLALCKKTRIKEKPAALIARVFGVFGAMLVALLAIFAVIMLIVPQLVTSIENLISNGRNYYSTVESWIFRLFVDYPDMADILGVVLDRVYHFLEEWIQNELLGTMQSVMSAVGSGIFSVINWLLDFLIGLIVAAYMLAGRKRYLAQMRKINAALWNKKIADWFLEIAAQANRVFGGFIRGKILDSIIIGVLCYIGALILKLPYAILVACIVGITNVIPFFGPFIGAIPCAFIILLVSPAKCLYFMIFVFLLQQLDGNVIGPSILGDTTGLSSFWVLVSITVFSGLFGFAGMILGVPVFAVLYILVKEIIEKKLSKKGLPTETEAYLDSAVPQVLTEPEKTEPEK
ncbi:MAG: AI-2E family transporter [Ruminococcaceae bacterium]|nr:AI-2E family transporter [Oscillospiraceae bacterium]